ncbi:MAG: tRNA (N6-threonylcarbamoyladenosine(37)-N6)-methyltransferase TrmO [Prevotella sp.]|nr:tRNA (N6-threonylcarbamoyladenosine(37)-N6)-methyltransferase TrmO [Prevotella sp.]
MFQIATFHSPLTSKFGAPRQAGVVPELLGRIILEPPFRSADAIRGMEGFDYLWLIWEFSANLPSTSSIPPSVTPPKLTVRPPRLGGNERVGVFASRSPFRPNSLGLSSVRIDHIDYDCPDAPVIYVKGADLIDGTPIYDIKPYIPYTDSHPDARAGFVDEREWQPLEVELSEEASQQLQQEEYSALRTQLPTLKDILSQDPRPHYHNSAERIYKMPYADYDVHFQVSQGRLTVVRIKKT